MRTRCQRAGGSVQCHQELGLWLAGASSVFIRRNRPIAPFPLTPALSLGERGNRRQRVREPGASGMFGRRSAGLPLLKGEGWGEGEQGHRTVAAGQNASGML